MGGLGLLATKDFPDCRFELRRIPVLPERGQVKELPALKKAPVFSNIHEVTPGSDPITSIDPSCTIHMGEVPTSERNGTGLDYLPTIDQVGDALRVEGW